MLLGEAISPIEEFLSLLAAKDFVAALALAPRTPAAGTFREGLESLWGDAVHELGEMPPSGWRKVNLVYSVDDGSAPGRAGLDVPAWDKLGVAMDWFFTFHLVSAGGEKWRIDYVGVSN